jgi:hypothetical protein
MVARHADLDARLSNAVLAVLVALGIAHVDAEGRYHAPPATPAAVGWAARIYGEQARVRRDPGEPGDASAVEAELASIRTE